MRSACSLAIAALAALAGLGPVLLPTPAAAQGSMCQAIASAPALAPLVRFVSLTGAPVRPALADDPSVAITFVGHSTFRIVSPDGTVIVTDYSGTPGPGAPPDVATMNHAHSTHYTPFPDPRIAHVLKGWGDVGGPAHYNLTIGDVLVRNVTTDIRTLGGLVEADGNSIFIFEVARLCLGHVGHLHQPLSDAQIAEIGRLDVVFVPIDGTYTMTQDAVMEVVRRLRAQVVVPMHWFSDFALAEFVEDTRDDGLAIDNRGGSAVSLSLATLPASPTLVVLKPLTND